MSLSYVEILKKSIIFRRIFQTPLPFFDMEMNCRISFRAISGSCPATSTRFPFSSRPSPYTFHTAPISSLPAPTFFHPAPISSHAAPITFHTAPITSVPAPFSSHAAPFPATSGIFPAIISDHHHSK